MLGLSTSSRVSYCTFSGGGVLMTLTEIAGVLKSFIYSCSDICSRSIFSTFEIISGGYPCLFTLISVESVYTSLNLFLRRLILGLLLFGLCRSGLRGLFLLGLLLFFFGLLLFFFWASQVVIELSFELGNLRPLS